MLARKLIDELMIESCVSGSLDYEEFARAVDLSVIDRCADVCNHLALTTSIDLIAAQGCAAAIRNLQIS